jgi:nitrite transporter NirC
LGKSTFLFDTAAAKMAAPLFFRAVLCNWLVCLALWMAARMTSDSAKCIAIFWCLFAFIACGYGHSVANMTLLALALVGNHPDTVSIGDISDICAFAETKLLRPDQGAGKNVRLAVM